MELLIILACGANRHGTKKFFVQVQIHTGVIAVEHLTLTQGVFLCKLVSGVLLVENVTFFR